jgi:plastocyanin
MKKFICFLIYLIIFSSFFSADLLSTTWTVTVQDFMFNPSNLPDVHIGDSIKWQWLGGIGHTTTSTSVPTGAATWDSPINNTVQTFIYPVTVAGSYQYKCTPHELMGMVGSFTVTPIGITPITGTIPKTFKLEQNYPNPFNPVTNIKLDIPRQTYVKLTIFNLIGSEVEILVNQQLSAGSYIVDWDASKYTSGVYIYKMEAGEFIYSIKMALIK